MGTKKIQSLRTHNQEKYGKQLLGLSLIFLYFFFFSPVSFFCSYDFPSLAVVIKNERETTHSELAIFQLVLCCNECGIFETCKILVALPLILKAEKW